VAPTSAIWQYAGGTWTSVRIAGSGHLKGLTCVTARECWAVGDQFTVPPGNDSDGVLKPVLEEDTGAGFLAVTGPAVPGDSDALDSVTCAGADDCWAVGGYGADSQNGGDGILHPLIEHYDGSAWTVVTSAGATLDYVMLDGVYCASRDECWAGGNASAGVVIEEFDGSSWSVVSTPQLVAPAGLSETGAAAFACINPDDCWVVGNTGSPTVHNQLTQPLIAQDTAGGWTLASSPYVSGPNGAVLSGVACLSADDCWAVGATNPEADFSPLILGPTPTPSPDPAMYSQPVLEHYTGGSWKVIPTAQSGTENEGLGTIMCDPSAGICDAVGAGGLEILTGS
jgi:hypothetical protein